VNTIVALASEIRCESVSLVFPDGTRAVDDVSLRIPAGSIVSLVGPSGCGKTSLLRLLAGLERPSSGVVVLDPAVSAVAGEIAFVFQQPALLPWRSALENVMLPLELTGRVPAHQQRDVAGELLADVGLSDALNKRPSELSGGMRMRVSIARALVTSPRVLLLDEPFAALDDLLRGQLGELLLELWARRRFTAVMVTHNIGEAILLSDQVIVMRSGKTQSPLTNPLPQPRSDSLRRTAEFGVFYGVISDCMRAGS
jgi:NitT/TauT family transport system ATP-binding protein